jgi:two-component system sensor histidine kinase KdpD
MHRERRSHSLFEVARALSAELVVEQVVETASKAIAREFHAHVRIYVLADDDRLTLTPSAVESPGLDPGTARWAFDHRQGAGLGTDTIPGSSWHYLPLNASMRTRGVLALQPESPRLFAVPEQRRQLETFAALTAIALERVHYVDVAQKATVQIESERLRNSLLSALSHDLRTPLAGLSGLAESLQMTGPSLSAAQHDIAEALVASAMRMSSQVNNLLEMARFESGEFRLSSAWNSIEEIVGSAVRLSKRVLASRTLRTNVPTGLPLVKCDAVLIERVLVNLLENAAKYTPPDAIVEVLAESAGEEMRVTVADNGPGIRPGTEQEIFNKFSRGVRESAIGGVGLGLAICKAIVEAHGGSISVANRGERGAAFTFTLPMSEAQPLAPDIDDPGAPE